MPCPTNQIQRGQNGRPQHAHLLSSAASGTDCMPEPGEACAHKHGHLQARWRGCRQRSVYSRTLQATIKIQAWVRQHRCGQRQSARARSLTLVRAPCCWRWRFCLPLPAWNQQHSTRSPSWQMQLVNNTVRDAAGSLQG